MMVGAAAHAAPAVRLRHQHRRPPHPDRRLRPGSQRRVARPRAQPRGDRLLRRGRRTCASYDEIERALRAGTARVALVIPPRFASDLRARPHRAGAARRRRLRSADGRQRDQHRRVAGRRALDASSLVARLRATGRRRRVQPIALEPNTWYNPELRTAVYVVPGLVGVILTMTMVMLTVDGDRARARARHARAADRLAGASASSWWSARSCPYVGDRLRADDADPAGRARWCSTCRCVGSLPLLYALAFVFIAANLALGLFFSTLAKTQQQAMQMSFFFLLPNILLSRLHVPVRGACRGPRSGCRRRCRSPTSCASCAASRSRARGFADVARRAGLAGRDPRSCWSRSRRCASARSSSDATSDAISDATWPAGRPAQREVGEDLRPRADQRDLRAEARAAVGARARAELMPAAAMP